MIFLVRDVVEINAKPTHPGAVDVDQRGVSPLFPEAAGSVGFYARRGKLFIACPANDFLDGGFLAIHEDADAVNLACEPYHEYETCHEEYE